MFNVILLGLLLPFDKMTLGFAASSNFGPFLGLLFCNKEDSAIICIIELSVLPNSYKASSSSSRPSCIDLRMNFLGHFMGL